MGKIQVGILGGFDGKVGTVVGGRWKGIDYIRHKGRKSTRPRSQQQLEVQAKFAVVTKFVSRIGELVSESFPDTPELTSPNVAFQHTYKNAVRGIYPDFTLDYSACLVSQGNLQNATLPMASAAGAGTVKFDWQDNTDSIMANANDKAIVVIYCPVMERAIIVEGPAERRAQTLTVNVANFTGKTVETWITFVSGSNEYASSLFTGEMIVA